MLLVVVELQEFVMFNRCSDRLKQRSQKTMIMMSMKMILKYVSHAEYILLQCIYFMFINLRVCLLESLLIDSIHQYDAFFINFAFSLPGRPRTMWLSAAESELQLEYCFKSILSTVYLQCSLSVCTLQAYVQTLDDDCHRFWMERWLRA